MECSLTEQIQRFADGDKEIAEAVLRAVWPRLHAIAMGMVNKERPLAPVCATELINEVWLKHLRHGGFKIRDRDHFYGIAGRAMRRVLVDYARNRLARSRGDGALAVSLNDMPDGKLSSNEDLHLIMEIDRLLELLEKRNRVGARIMDLHYFAGFTCQEIAEVTGLSVRSVQRRYKESMDWMKDRLS